MALHHPDGSALSHVPENAFHMFGRIVECLQVQPPSSGPLCTCVSTLLAACADFLGSRSRGTDP
jgi:hypothetical protein